MSKPHDNRIHSNQKTVRGARRRGHAIHPCMPIYLSADPPATARSRGQ